MIDAIDTDMHARPGDVELIPWLLVLDFAPQHVAKEFRSIMRDTRPHIKLCYVQRNSTAYTQPLDRAYTRACKSSIRSEVAEHFGEFFLEAESNFERVNLDCSTSVLRQLLLSFVHTAAQNADRPQHRTAGWRFIDWDEVQQRELHAEAKRLLEMGDLLFPRGTAEEPLAPEAHVMEPLADDHSSDGEEALALMSRNQRHQPHQRLPLLQRGQPCACYHQRDSASVSRTNRKLWCTIRDQEPGYQLSVTCARVQVRVNRASTLLVQKELSFVVVASLSIRSSRCFHVFSRSSPVPSFALRLGSNDQCDGNQWCPSFGGSLRKHHQEWSLRFNLLQHVKTHQVLTHRKN